MHWNCFLSSVAADCKDGQGLKLKKNGLTFSSFNGMAAKNYHKIITRAVSPFLQIYWGECTRARASSGEASRSEKRGRSHLLKLPSRAFGHARGHLRVSRILLDGPRKKTARGNKELNLIIKHRIQQNKHWTTLRKASNKMNLIPNTKRLTPNIIKKVPNILN